MHPQSTGYSYNCVALSPLLGGGQKQLGVYARSMGQLEFIANCYDVGGIG